MDCSLVLTSIDEDYCYGVDWFLLYGASIYLWSFFVLFFTRLKDINIVFFFLSEFSYLFLIYFQILYSSCLTFERDLVRRFLSFIHILHGDIDEHGRARHDGKHAIRRYTFKVPFQKGKLIY